MWFKRTGTELGIKDLEGEIKNENALREEPSNIFTERYGF